MKREPRGQQRADGTAKPQKLRDGKHETNARRENPRRRAADRGAVMQDDLLNANLTVLETLNYTAQLRLPRSLSEAERTERVRAVMEQMGLTRVQDVIVGSPLRKGLSGGERKRLCVATELLTRPALLFLDEPTSGLDSVTALALCRSLRQLADARVCTVVCTIHQPQTKIFRLFQNLVLLRAGRIVYLGPAEEAEHFFQGLGFKCPPNENPADYFLDVITPSSNEDSMLPEQFETLQKSAEAQSAALDLSSGIDHPLPPRATTPWGHQFVVLFRRTMKDLLRRRSLLATQLAQTVIMAVLIGTAFKQIGTSESSILRRQPVLFFCVINQGIFGSLLVINSFPQERMLVLRERAAGTYYVSAYFLAKSMAEMIFQLIIPVLFTCIVYFLIGLHEVPAKFFVFMGFMVSFPACRVCGSCNMRSHFEPAHGHNVCRFSVTWLPPRLRSWCPPSVAQPTCPSPSFRSCSRRRVSSAGSSSRLRTCPPTSSGWTP